MSVKNLCCAVWIVTYNHEKYIARAIESVINQKVSFSYKILIGDDNSSDKTSAICKSYAEQYPDKIELLVNPQNIGAHNNGVNTYYRCFQSGAKWIALLEGDDFWLDDDKLQKQIDFLEAHPQYVGCFHNTEERYENDDEKASFLYCNYSFARNISFDDLSYRNLIPTCSVVFRNNLFGKFPDWYNELKMGDWPLHLLNSQFGDYWYIPKVMAVHRLHAKSTWMLQDADRNNQFVIDAYDVMIKGFRENKTYVGFLTAGKESFVRSIQPVKPESRTRRRVKSLIKRVIDKL